MVTIRVRPASNRRPAGRPGRRRQLGSQPAHRPTDHLGVGPGVAGRRRRARRRRRSSATAPSSRRRAGRAARAGRRRPVPRPRAAPRRRPGTRRPRDEVLLVVEVGSSGTGQHGGAARRRPPGRWRAARRVEGVGGEVARAPGRRRPGPSRWPGGRRPGRRPRVARPGRPAGRAPITGVDTGRRPSAGQPGRAEELGQAVDGEERDGGHADAPVRDRARGRPKPGGGGRATPTWLEGTTTVTGASGRRTWRRRWSGAGLGRRPAVATPTRLEPPRAES